MKKRSISRITLFSAVLFAVLLVWLTLSLTRTEAALRDNRKNYIYSSVMNGAALCYSIEGEYPPDIQYLEDNYGVRYDPDEYIVHYSYFGATIRPSVTVTEKG